MRLIQTFIYQPGLLIGSLIDHKYLKLQGIGYYLELIIMIGPYCKKEIQATMGADYWGAAVHKHPMK